jgi:hypothetical protein
VQTSSLVCGTCLARSPANGEGCGGRATDHVRVPAGWSTPLPGKAADLGKQVCAACYLLPANQKGSGKKGLVDRPIFPHFWAVAI